MPAMCMRFWPGWSCLKKIVGEKTYGPVRAASFRRVSAKPAGATETHMPAGHCWTCTFMTLIL